MVTYKLTANQATLIGILFKHCNYPNHLTMLSDIIANNVYTEFERTLLNKLRIVMFVHIQKEYNV